MTSKQKNIITLLSVFLPSLAALALFGIIMLIRAVEGAASVGNYERRAVKYVEQKYGETVRPLSHKASYRSGRGGRREVKEITIDFDGFEVFANDKVICDDRQYDEIKAAVEEKYITDDKLGSSWSGDWELVFCEAEEKHEYCSVYFDGDLEKFLSEAAVTLHADITYEGYPEKDGEYRRLLTDKASEINEIFDLTEYSGEDNLDVSLYVRNPAAVLREMTHKGENPARIYHEARFEEYMGYIAYAYTGHRAARGGYMPFESETRVYHPEFAEIDEYTAVSDNLTPIVSKSEVTFEPVDLSYNTTVYPVRYDEGGIDVRKTGYRVGLDRNVCDIFLRLDREHYGITEQTVPLTVSYGSEKREYMSVGRSGDGIYSYDEDDWYYLDDKYLYLFIYSHKYEFGTDSDQWVLAFYDIAEQ